MTTLMKLVDALEDDDDVQRVTTNFRSVRRGHGPARRWRLTGFRKPVRCGFSRPHGSAFRRCNNGRALQGVLICRAHRCHSALWFRTATVEPHRHHLRPGRIRQHHLRPLPAVAQTPCNIIPADAVIGQPVQRRHFDQTTLSHRIKPPDPQHLGEMRTVHIGQLNSPVPIQIGNRHRGQPAEA